jgi:predicted metal-dependent enzyme (double-stranded beta helix superfamily)
MPQHQMSSLTEVPIPPRLAPSPIAALGAEIGAACEGPAGEKSNRVVAALRRTAAILGLLTPAERQPRRECYARHRLYSDPSGRFTILSLVWGPGQFSLPHAHHVWCAYAVVENELTETLYDFDSDCQKALVLGSAARVPGFACFAEAGLDQIHRLGNAGSEPAISLHVYGVDGERVATHVNRLVDVAGQKG